MVTRELLVGETFEVFQVGAVDVAQHFCEVVLAVAVCKPDVIDDALKLRGVGCLCEEAPFVQVMVGGPELAQTVADQVAELGAIVLVELPFLLLVDETVGHELVHH